MAKEPAMAERLHHSSDVPTFDTYPASPPVNPSGALPPDHLLEEGRPLSPMEQRAADLGAAAGKVVFMVKQARLKAEHLPQHPVFDRLSNLADNARVRAEYLRSRAGDHAQRLAQTARERTAELGQQARDKAADIGRQARTGYYRVRLRANQTAREYPVHVVAAAGIVGFLIGVGLRIRRANRAY
jgi:ElaB/YqjD/DUF883 family membrane-anchored ribosome-binding protein